MHSTPMIVLLQNYVSAILRYQHDEGPTLQEYQCPGRDGIHGDPW